MQDTQGETPSFLLRRQLAAVDGLGPNPPTPGLQQDPSIHYPEQVTPRHYSTQLSPHHTTPQTGSTPFSFTTNSKKGVCPVKNNSENVTMGM